MRALAKFAFIFALIWTSLYEIQNQFPYLLTGADAIFQAKLKRERAPHLFRKPDSPGVLFFGNSKALSGFMPDLFDDASREAGHPTESYNLGLPAYYYFVDRLESILAAGNIPKYIVITLPWAPNDEPPDAFHFIRHDFQLMDELFPFHLLGRDLLMAATSSIRMRGFLIRYYETNRRIVERVIADRGYFFIYDSKYSPNNQLPAGFRGAFDRPGAVFERLAGTRGREFEKLVRLLKTYHITCLLVPTYYRVGQAAPPPAQNQRLRAELASYPDIRLLGPDYVLFKNRYFSDGSHLNPEGARLYTLYIADLVAPSLR